MRRIAKARNCEVWVRYDRTAGVYEMFASEEGSDYIGCSDTLTDAQAYAKNWIAERVASQ
jgi:hypothetical protein